MQIRKGKTFPKKIKERERRKISTPKLDKREKTKEKQIKKKRKRK